MSDAIDRQISYYTQALVLCFMQSWSNGDVLTLAYMNEQTLLLTPARNRVSASTKRPRTCSTTCWSSCAAGNARCSTPSGCSMAVAPSAQPPGGPRVAQLPITPSLERARELAASHNLIPLSITFV